MKKSILWTAAGVVSATAIWAAISLPYKQAPAPVVPATTPYHDAVSASPLPSTSQWSLVIQPVSGVGGILYSGEPTKVLLEWDGANLVGDDGHGKSICTIGGKPRAITLCITRQTQESGPGFSRTRRIRFTKTLQPGETLDL